ncbi:peptidylprolyl isomerase [Rhodobacter veldkampii DSM 11550]|uniref:Peptidyl-prolyl cis-trans isomerase n=1 Tax=Phaeovulum veldkampii DSM 11550 TaxID=1185920 RepID=A0A2T4JN11_9RHOB|nr:peptidylprolyl isomerase [Phaeovulum veldkampii]MBK5947409.1 peptidylprolyl isomerase [Phaeovulum veldkampii DSM 11550]PTE19266.1 peptidylprolyl isomerase [Phaeovulum veldkampii DSM 11550]TDQ62249.1 peptidylprolyl isomerase [Phaeovulum veldkampii DSM 11550]
MSERVFALALAAGLALTGGALAETGSGVVDGPGPNLVLEVAGAAQGRVVIDLLPDVAPRHVEQITALAAEGAYDEVVFHRVIEGFMAQTGDVQFGKRAGDLSLAGMGGSQRPDLPAEFSNRAFVRGMVGMARSQSPDSANSQFFIMFDEAPYLDGQYTIVGHVVEGMDVVDAIKKGDQRQNGLVADPDYIQRATVE